MLYTAALVADHSNWPDERIHREFDAVWARINGLPDRMTKVEGSLEGLKEDVHRDVNDLRQDVQKLTTPGWTRGEKLMAGGTVGTFLAAGAAVLTAVFG